MKILVTGGTGFIGEHFINALINEKIFVIALKRKDSRVNEALRSDLLSWITVEENIKLSIKKDEKFDVVVHLATSYNRSGVDFINSEMVNVVLPLNLMDYCLNNSCNYFINIDTFSSHEKYKHKHLEEYNLTKNNFLRWANLICQKNKEFNFVNARLQHVYGPGDRNGKFMTMIANELLKNEGKIDLTSCNQSRDFIYVTDVVNALLKIIYNKEKITGFKEVEIGTGNEFQLKYFLTLAKNIAKSKTILNFNAIPLREDEIMNSVADISILESLGWRPEISIEKGISLMLDGCRKNLCNEDNKQ